MPCNRCTDGLYSACACCHKNITYLFRFRSEIRVDSTRTLHQMNVNVYIHYFFTLILYGTIKYFITFLISDRANLRIPERCHSDVITRGWIPIFLSWCHACNGRNSWRHTVLYIELLPQHWKYLPSYLYRAPSHHHNFDYFLIALNIILSLTWLILLTIIVVL